MQKSIQSSLNSEKWVTIRDFVDDETGYTLPKYEAKYVADVDKQFLEDDLVLVKRTEAITGGEHLYHFPRSVFEGVVDRL